MEEQADNFENLLDPDRLKPNLITAALYITAYDMLKANIVERPRSFWSDLTEGGMVPNAEYKSEVLDLDPLGKRAVLRGSLQWWLKQGALSDDDLEVFEQVTLFRNELAHNLAGFLLSPDAEYARRFIEVVELMRKVEVWWFINFELALDPDMLPEGTNPEEVISLNRLFLSLMLDAALGDEDKARAILEEYRSQRLRTTGGSDLFGRMGEVAPSGDEIANEDLGNL